MPRIKIDFSKCTGCRYCEAVCALEHFKVVNPMKSRIRVISDSKNRTFIPLIAGPFTDAQCTNKTVKVVGGVEMDGCSLCPASSCPSRHLFVEAGTGIPLKCDMCESNPPLEKPMCVQWCLAEALIYEEREEEVTEEVPTRQELETGLESLANKHGMQKVLDAIARMSKKG